jgi:NSS family neurotransmitter:Na+ symporter
MSNSAGSTAWGSTGGFLMASIGFAVGLGNIWRFPYVTGENGGSAFVVVYLGCAFLIGVPILMAEIMLGRRGGFSPPASIHDVASAAGLSRHWSWIGTLNVTTAFLIQMAYAVVAGWVLYYFFLALTGQMPGADSLTAKTAFDNVLLDVPTSIFWTVLALVTAGAIICAGVQQGIERAVKILMPTLFALLLVLFVFNLFAGGVPETLAYLFLPDFSKISADTFLAALSQAFFSIGVAMGGMMMFGAYLPKSISVAKCALIIVAADTGVALLAGLVIFPMVFNNGMAPDAGTGLIFLTLPLAFHQMWGGDVVAVLFFLLLSVAAVTSMVGLAEPITGTVMQWLKISRVKATLLATGTLLPFSIMSVLTYNHWADVALFGNSIGALVDYIPNQVFLPLGGLLIALLVAWFLPKHICADELAIETPRYFNIWYQLMRFVVVPAIFVILVTTI